MNLQSEVAMLMPCNLVFWENIDSSVTISVINAEKQLNVTKNRDLIILGQDVDRMLRNAVDAL